MQITRDMPMADIIHLNYLLLRVIGRFDIRLGFENKTVSQVCKENNINIDFFLEIVNSFHDTEYFPEKKLQNFPVNYIVKYLQKTHSYYIDIKLPEIETLLNNLAESCANSNKKNLISLTTFFHEYRKEFIAHIEREEKVVLPYVLQIEKAFLSKSGDVLPVGFPEFSIAHYAKEHDNVEDKLFDLKNIIIKFLPPVHDVETCNNLLIELFRLEKDLNNHARIEDAVLVPKVAEMEKDILKRKSK